MKNGKAGRINYRGGEECREQRGGSAQGREKQKNFQTTLHLGQWKESFTPTALYSGALRDTGLWSGTALQFIPVSRAVFTAHGGSVLK